MGITNIRSGDDFLKYAGRPFSRAFYALLPELRNQEVIIDCLSSASEELEQYVELFRSGQNDVWMAQDATTTKRLTPVTFRRGEAVYVPRVKISPAFKMWIHGSEDEKAQAKVDLAYVLVLQGASGALKSRLSIRYSLDDVGSELLSAAANRLNVVFSGAVLRKNGGLLQDPNFEVVKVVSADHLRYPQYLPTDLEKLDAENKQVVGILC